MRSVSSFLIEFVVIFLTVWRVFVFARIIFSFFRPNYGSPLARVASFVWGVTEPVLDPIRRRLPPMAGLDFSPLIALLLAELVGGVLVSLIRQLPF